MPSSFDVKFELDLTYDALECVFKEGREATFSLIEETLRKMMLGALPLKSYLRSQRVGRDFDEYNIASQGTQRALAVEKFNASAGEQLYWGMGIVDCEEGMVAYGEGFDARFKPAVKYYLDEVFSKGKRLYCIADVLGDVKGLRGRLENMAVQRELF